MLNSKTKQLLIEGPAGTIELAIDMPDTRWQGAWRGLAVAAHPHPLFGGNLDNKVAQTLARTFAQLGYLCVRPNFRGVGASEGNHDDGIGEQKDILAIIDWIRQSQNWQSAAKNLDELNTFVSNPLFTQIANCPLALGGFSFGAYVTSHVAAYLEKNGNAAEHLVLVGTPSSRWDICTVAADTIVIHGEHDETIPLASVFDWARPQMLPVTVIPGADHFFHRKLHLIRQIITGAWSVRAAV